MLAGLLCNQRRHIKQLGGKRDWQSIYKAIYDEEEKTEEIVNELVEAAREVIAETPEIVSSLPTRGTWVIPNYKNIDIGQLRRDLDALERLADAVEAHEVKKVRKLKRRVEEATLLTLLLS